MGEAPVRQKDCHYVTFSKFAGLGLSEPLLRALEHAQFDTPTPIQAKAIPLILAGRDLLGLAQTGTGKTAAFALPLLQRLAEEGGRTAPRQVRGLILAPTRELVVQIAENVGMFGRGIGLSHAIVMGGVGLRPQVDRLRRGVDILIATPGRLLDLVDNGHLDLSATRSVVLDEADRMLDMGFIRDVRRIVRLLPSKRQSLLFSATMPKDVARLAAEILDRPERVEIASKSVAVERIDQSVYHMPAAEKRDRLQQLLADPDMERVIVFTRTKHGADRVVKHLDRGGVSAGAIHGNKSQGARQRVLDGFRDGQVRVLVATDIASRGIDVEDVTHVINFELPNIPESYVHRIGRTARAGAGGVAISFCDESERPHLRSIEQLIRRSIPIVGDPPVEGKVGPAANANTRGESGEKRPGGRRRRSRARRTSRRAA